MTVSLVFILEAMSQRIGVDIDALITAREVLLHRLHDEVIYNNLPEVGLPKGYTYANAKGAACPMRDKV